MFVASESGFSRMRPKSGLDSASWLVMLKTDPEALLAELEETVTPHETADLDVVISGVPPIVEMIRRALFRDLVVFSTAAVVVFALLIGLLYRELDAAKSENEVTIDKALFEAVITSLELVVDDIGKRIKVEERKVVETQPRIAANRT